AGYRGRPVVTRIVDRTGRTVQEQRADARGDGEAIAFRFQMKPEEPGLSFYQVRVSTPAEAPLPDAPEPASTEEATLANNSRVFAVDRGRGPFRVLYVSGRPNWEYKFLNRAVQAD